MCIYIYIHICTYICLLDIQLLQLALRCSACHDLKPVRSSLFSDHVAEQLEGTTLTHILEQESCGLKEWLMTAAADASPEVRDFGSCCLSLGAKHANVILSEVSIQANI